MGRILVRVATLGLIVTCLADPKLNLYAIFQVSGQINFDGGCLRFLESKGDYIEACDVACTVVEGEIPPPGTDMRGIRSGKLPGVPPLGDPR